MFCKKTYRKTRWIERLLNHGLPTTDLDSDFDEPNVYDDEYDGYYDEDYDPNYKGPKKWLIVNPKFVVRIKRGRWTPVQYFRLAFENHKPYLECVTSIDQQYRPMKIFKPHNHVGVRNISVTKAITD